MHKKTYGFVFIIIRNHNIAVQLISPESKYCKMLHADDHLFPECIERMVEVAEANPNVGIVGSYTILGDEIRCVGIPYPIKVMSGKEICRATFLGDYTVFGSPTALLIRNDLIGNGRIIYNEGSLHGDVELCLELLKNSDFGFVHQILTYLLVCMQNMVLYILVVRNIKPS